MAYERLSILDFGKTLLETGDLDPIYCALRNTGWDAATTSRFLMAYWSWYNAGSASWMAEKEGDAYWDAMMVAARNEESAPTPFGERWPRAKERRHARGSAAVKMVEHLVSLGQDPLEIVSRMISPHSDGVVPYNDVRKRVKKHYLFGEWIAFKVADMAERCMGVKVNFDNAAVFMFTDPVKAALMVWRQQQGLPENAMPRDKTAVLNGVTEWMAEQFKDMTAPPLNAQIQRKVGLQEVETILCKWKSHMGGHYPVLNDIHEIGLALTPWAKLGGLAKEFSDAMPNGEKLS